MTIAAPHPAAAAHIGPTRTRRRAAESVDQRHDTGIRAPVAAIGWPNLMAEPYTSAISPSRHHCGGLPVRTIDRSMPKSEECVNLAPPRSGTPGKANSGQELHIEIIEPKVLAARRALAFPD